MLMTITFQCLILAYPIHSFQFLNMMSRTPLLIATDVAARGLDIPQVEVRQHTLTQWWIIWSISFSLPSTSSSPSYLFFASLTILHPILPLLPLLFRFLRSLSLTLYLFLFLPLSTLYSFIPLIPSSSPFPFWFLITTNYRCPYGIYSQYVINYSFPLTVEDYVHRIGRTGRGGATGISHTFFTDFDKVRELDEFREFIWKYLFLPI